METQGLSNVSHESYPSDKPNSSKGLHEEAASHGIQRQPIVSATHHEFAPSGGNSIDLQKTSSGLRHARQYLGLHPNAPIIEEHDTAAHSDLWWPKLRLVLKEPFAEFFGVFIMVLFGDGSVAQVLLSAGQTSAPGGNGFGSYQSISWGWGLGVMLGIYVAGDSGAYLKYARTL